MNCGYVTCDNCEQSTYSHLQSKISTSRLKMSDKKKKVFGMKHNLQKTVTLLGMDPGGGGVVL